jgi:hypothetical protein
VISFQQPLADAYVPGARNIMLPSSPGRQVRFLSGHAVVKDGRDMVALMRNQMVKLVLTPFALDWFPVWEKQAGQIRAEIIRPAREKVWDSKYRPDVTDSDQPGT